MRRAALLACCTVLSLVVLSGRGAAQSVPAAPAVDSVRSTAHTLTVTWRAPAGASGITAYDLRYIRSASPVKTIDANWTLVDDVWVTGGGALSHQLTDLRDSTDYDIQVRATNATGDSPWSATWKATTSDHGRATMQIGSSIKGRISTGTDQDLYDFTVTEATRVYFYTTGALDTVATLYSISGGTTSEVSKNDDRYSVDGEFSSGLTYTLQPSRTYRLVITSFGRLTGNYSVHATMAPTPGTSTATAPTIEIDRQIRSTIASPGGASGQKDYFKVVTTEAVDVWIVALGDLAHTSIDPELNFDTGWSCSIRMGRNWRRTTTRTCPRRSRRPSIRRQLEANSTYYITVRGDRSHGSYTLHLKSVELPGSTIAAAVPAQRRMMTPGDLSSSTDKDYFAVTVDTETFVEITLHHPRFLGDLTGDLYDADGAKGASFLRTRDRQGAGFSNDTRAWLWARLDPGTHYFEVSSSNRTGHFLFILEFDSGMASIQNGCDSGDQTDAFYDCQWYLNNTGQYSGTAGMDINVEEVWATNKGEGINVAIVDTGVQIDHEDLVDNVHETFNHNYYPDSPGIYDPTRPHGTKVAGLVAARDNGFGVRGVAPRATIYSYNLNWSQSQGLSLIADALGRNASVTAVSNNSWGGREEGDPYSPGIVFETALEQGVKTGYGGKGVVYVWTAGNGARNGDNSNLDGLGNHYTGVTVCSITPSDRRADYSERGANLWLCSPSSSGYTHSPPHLATTDMGHRYNLEFGGTSGAAPIVSGVVALIRKANAALTWRDVKLILAASARKNDSGSRSWQTGASKYGATGNYNYSHDYGFGTVDAGAAVGLARDWTNVPAMRESEAESGTVDLDVGEATSDGRAGTAGVSTITMNSYVEFVEFIEVRVTLDHPSARDLRIQLRSPSGAVSTLAYPFSRGQARGSSTFPVEFPDGYRFGSAKHLGENAGGTWALTVTDNLRGNTGSLTSWSIRAIGHGTAPGPPPAPTATSGMRTLTIDWDAPTDAGDSVITSYDLRYIRDSATDKADANWTVVTGIGTDDTGAYEITGLGPGALYDLQVRAVSSSGDGAWSDLLEARPTQEKPFVPTITVGEDSPRGAGPDLDRPHRGWRL